MSVPVASVESFADSRRASLITTNPTADARRFVLNLRQTDWRDEPETSRIRGVEAMTQRTSNAAPMLLRANEAARTLALSERKLWELTNRGEIRSVRIGRAVRYDPKDLLAWIETSKNARR